MGLTYTRSWRTPSACNIWHILAFPRSQGLRAVTDGLTHEDVRSLGQDLLILQCFVPHLSVIREWELNPKYVDVGCVCTNIVIQLEGEVRSKGGFVYLTPLYHFGLEGR